VAAALYDIHGHNEEQIAEEDLRRIDLSAGWSKDKEPRFIRAWHPRTTRKAIKEGRALWSHLEAWPWHFWSGGRPADSRAWRAEGPREQVATALRDWLAGHQSPLDLQAAGEGKLTWLS
jgi:hypothetical protein